MINKFIFLFLIQKIYCGYMYLLSTQNNFNTVKIYGYEKFYKFTHLEIGHNLLTLPMGEHWKHLLMFLMSISLSLFAKKLQKHDCFYFSIDILWL